MPAFTSSLFFNVLLPPIILDSSYALYDHDFFDNLGPILTFAFAGTVFNVALVAVFLKGVAAMGAVGTISAQLTWLQTLIFASLVTLAARSQR